MRILLSFLILFFVQVALAATNLYTSTKAVTTAGTRVALVSTNTFTASVVIQAKCGNTGYIYLGDSTVTSSNGIRLSACDKFTMTFDNVPSMQNPIDLNKLYLDSSVNGEGVNFLYTSWK